MHYLDIEQCEGNKVRVSYHEDANPPHPSPPVPFTHPFTPEVMDDLLWYYEEYLTFPYGGMEDRGKRVAESLSEWGAKLFKTVFADDQAKENYFRAVNKGWDNCEIRILSKDAGFLNIPWEMLYDSSKKRFLAHQSAGLYRSHPEIFPVERDTDKDANETFNILLIISRPYGERDVQLRTIARPMLEVLSPIADRIHLDVLRPPTFGMLKKVLEDKPGFYHLIHFDGHGAYDPNASGLHHAFDGEDKGQGLLVFHGESEQERCVPAEELGETLTRHKIPLFVLNACQSAMQSEADSYSSVATSLLNTGAEAVVAMSYSVYALGAKAFMRGFYESLANNKSIAEAMTKGRTDMMNDRLRPSPQGMKPLLDWPIPVLYQQRHSIPLGTFKPSEKPTLEQSIQTAALQVEEMQASQGTYGFVGRDNDVARLERAFEKNTALVVRGMAGIGKTSLAREYALWRMQTGGIPAGVHWFSFKNRDTVKGFMHLLDTVGNKLFGEKYGSIPNEKQRETALASLLKEHFALLILDNFETVAGFGEEEVYWEKSERDRLVSFLKKLQDGATKIIITTRSLTDKEWLGSTVTDIELKGLNEEDQQVLAQKIFQKKMIAPEALDKSYLDLLKTLGGHPLAYQLILPCLKDQQPQELLHALSEGKVDFKDAAQEEDRNKALFASLDYSLQRLSEKSRKLLPVLGLFRERINRDVLVYLWQNEAFVKIWGEITEDDWTAVLTETAEVGVIQEVNQGSFIYEMHPVLPGYLKAQLAAKLGVAEFGSLEEAWVETYAILSNQLVKGLLSGQGQAAMTIAAMEETNLLHALRLALQSAETAKTVDAWDRVQYIVQYLISTNNIQSRREDNRQLRAMILDRIGWQGAQAEEKGALKLWEFVIGNEVNAALNEHRLEEAEKITQDMMAFYNTQPSTPKTERSKAYCFEKLGHVAEGCRDFSQATKEYRKAYELSLKVGDEREAAVTSHQLGLVAHKQEDWAEAEKWYQTSIELKRNLQNEAGEARTLNQLGLVAHKQQKWDEAKKWFLKSLEIMKKLRNEAMIAIISRNLGILAERQEDWGEADKFYKNSIELLEKIQHPTERIPSYAQYALFNRNFGHWEITLGYFIRALNLACQVGHEHYQQRILHDLGITKQVMTEHVGPSAFDDLWRRITHTEPPV